MCVCMCVCLTRETNRHRILHFSSCRETSIGNSMTRGWHWDTLKTSLLDSVVSPMMLMLLSCGAEMERHTFSKVHFMLFCHFDPLLTDTFPLFHNVSQSKSTGDQYWRFDSKADPPVSSRYPKPIKNWVGLPSSIDAAFKWENGLTYFFKDIYYYRFNDADFEVCIQNTNYVRLTT